MDNNYAYDFGSSKVQESSVIKNIFIWMAVGLAITGFVSHSFYTSGLILRTGNLIMPLFIGQIVLVWVLSRNIMKYQVRTGVLLFLIYATISGITLSPIFLVYTGESIANTFFITAGVFGVMAFYGITTKRDLTKMGTYLFMGLIGLIIASVVNFFLRSSTLAYIASFAGVIIFTGLTAYDVQKFSKISRELGEGRSDMALKISVIGALHLYLDFINLFLYLLRFLGRRK